MLANLWGLQFLFAFSYTNIFVAVHTKFNYVPTYIQEFNSIYILHLRDKLQHFSHTCQFKLLRILYYSITEKFHYAWKAKDGMVHNGL